MPDTAPPQTAPEVLTLTEAAGFLRVSEEALAKLADERSIPAQRIGSEWRFLKAALVAWLHLGPRPCRDWPGVLPPWTYDFPLAPELLRLLEGRVLDRLALLETERPKRGSRQAVLRHFGVFKDDPDLPHMLDDIYARRKGKPAEDEG